MPYKPHTVTNIPEYSIIDIELPVKPLDSSLLSIENVFLAVIIILTIYFIRHIVVSRRFGARQKLSAVQRDYSADVTNSRATAFQLAATVREALSLNHLSQTTQLPNKIQQHHDRWINFVTLLDEARYSSAECSVDSIQQLFSDAGFWLRQWPKQCKT